MSGYDDSESKTGSKPASTADRKSSLGEFLAEVETLGSHGETVNLDGSADRESDSLPPENTSNVGYAESADLEEAVAPVVSGAEAAEHEPQPNTQPADMGSSSWETETCDGPAFVYSEELDCFVEVTSSLSYAQAVDMIRASSEVVPDVELAAEPQHAEAPVPVPADPYAETISEPSPTPPVETAPVAKPRNRFDAPTAFDLEDLPESLGRLNRPGTSGSTKKSLASTFSSLKAMPKPELTLTEDSQEPTAPESAAEPAVHPAPEQPDPDHHVPHHAVNSVGTKKSLASTFNSIKALNVRELTVDPSLDLQSANQFDASPPAAADSTEASTEGTEDENAPRMHVYHGKARDSSARFDMRKAVILVVIGLGVAFTVMHMPDLSSKFQQFTNMLPK